MRKVKYGTAAIYAICALLMLAAFFATDFVLYEFHMEVTDYTYQKTDIIPVGADTSVWFDYGTHGRDLFYGYTEKKLYEQAQFFMRTSGGVQKLADPQEIPVDSLGNLIAVLPMQSIDVDGDGTKESVYDFARADFGANAFNPVPQRFDSDKIPFELIFSKRNRIEVRYLNEQLIGAELLLTTHNGKQITCQTDENGWIAGLAQQDIRYGFTAVYSPDGNTVYRMYYALEDYPFFSWHTLEAHFPLFVVIGLSFLLILLIEMIRRWMFRNDPVSQIQLRGGLLQKNPLRTKTESKFLFIRWCFLWFGMFAMTYTERDKTSVQTVDCLLCGECIHKCPENNALQITFCGKPIYKSSRKSFISKYAPEKTKTSDEKKEQPNAKMRFIQASTVTVDGSCTVLSRSWKK